MVLSDEILANSKTHVLQLLQAGEDVNQIDIYGYTPLIEAAIANNSEMAQLLLEHHAQVDKPDLTGGTALHWAVENNNLDLCHLLLKRGADPNAYTHYSQPVLVQPLLRRQQNLKELLYRYGADLKFAQDYINTKLMGHRFELTGRVDIVDHKGKFIEVDLEGFVLEFTISVIRDSLIHFKNNFSARNLRSHFVELQIVMDAFMAAAELIKYQQYMTDLTEHKKRIETLANNECLILPVGFEGHAISFVKYGDLFAKCDRGENSLHNPSVGIYKIHNREIFDSAFVRFLLYKKHDRYFMTQGIFQTLQLELVTELSLPSQLTGNCSWANIEAAIPTLLFMLWLRNNEGRSEEDLLYYKELVMAIYRQWLEWDKDWALHQCVESFYDASPARKASKASLLAAVLFQTCRYTVPEALVRANKILAVLATPGYEYVLESYLKIYKNTELGRNLVELIDLYSK